ncbi:putative iron-regulated membrane protein [Nocardioides albertanoniae]|uniref:Putative iron-regulated membrane protein n=1 Tax=Nocardioides albertanoniae TaxID=1175486 RepID=A0A543A7C7_9ACTN|nr:PepSY domain-containing protein [Nocardioides albertanoniae]TQL68376.1 putative iron-regulated membrane protein [Nocardioides albertanoniae]
MSLPTDVSTRVDVSTATSPAAPAGLHQVAPPHDRAQDPVEHRGRTWWPLIRPLVLRMHFYAGLLVAPFILVASVTGLLYTLAPQVEQVAYHDLTHVTPAGPRVSYAEQVAAARQSHPGGDIVRVDVPQAGDRSTRVVFTDETVPADYDMSVFVNPYTATVEGQVRSFGQWLGFRAWLDELHRNLHLGALGRSYSELAASWLWVVALGGLMLWIGRQTRIRRDRGGGRLGFARRLVTPDLAARRRRLRVVSWHAVIGVWALLGVLALSVSGLTWSRFAGDHIGEVRTALSWSEPTPSTSLAPGGVAAEHSHHGAHGGSATATDPDAVFTDGAGVDGVVAAAREAGLGDPLYLVPPADASSAWTAAENKRSWPTRYDAISVDPAGGVVDRVDFADWPLMAKVTDWVIGAHMGILFGIVNQVALAMLAIGLIVVTLYGYRMWWLRRPRGASGLRFGRPAPRGGLRRLPWPALAALVTLAAVVGWFVPMLGVSLIGFVLVDAAVGIVRRRRRAG